MNLLQKIKSWLYVEEEGVMRLEVGAKEEGKKVIYARIAESVPATVRRNRITGSVSIDRHVVNHYVAVYTYVLKKGEYLLVSVSRKDTPKSESGTPIRGWMGSPNGPLNEWRLVS